MKKIILIISLITFFHSSLLQANENKDRPNVVVFIVDDMGLMDTSVPFITDAQGKPSKQPLNDWYHTPNMEKLAEKGMRFSQFYAQSVCSPTRASLLSGKNATRHHTTTWINPVNNNRGKFGPKAWNWQGLTSKNITFPKLLQQQGYETIHIGKGHFGPLKSEGADPLNLGFDVNIAGGPWGRPKSYYGHNQYGNHPKYKKEGIALTHNIKHLSAYYDEDIFLTEALTLEANKQISQAVAQDKPFLLYLSHYAVHAPFDRDPRFAKRYINQDMSSKAQAYATLVEGMDKSLGDITKQLKKLGVAENTLIIFVGDNGSDAPLGNENAIASSAPLKGKKGSSWEGGMRAPLIVAWASLNKNIPSQQHYPILKNSVNTQITSILDIFPTVLSVTNTPSFPNNIIDGEDLSPLFEGEKTQDKQANLARKNSFLMHFPHKHRHSYFTTYRLGDWKIIYKYNPEDKKKVKRYQLFNLANDIDESNDLSSSHPDKLQSMMESMVAELARENAQYPIAKDGTPLLPILPKQVKNNKAVETEKKINTSLSIGAAS